MFFPPGSVFTGKLVFYTGLFVLCTPRTDGQVQVVYKVGFSLKIKLFAFVFKPTEESPSYTFQREWKIDLVHFLEYKSPSILIRALNIVKCCQKRKTLSIIRYTL